MAAWGEVGAHVLSQGLWAVPAPSSATGSGQLLWHTLVTWEVGLKLLLTFRSGPGIEGSTDGGSMYRAAVSRHLTPICRLNRPSHIRLVPLPFPSSSDRKLPIHGLPRSRAVQLHAHVVLFLLGEAPRSAGECSSHLVSLSA